MSSHQLNAHVAKKVEEYRSIIQGTDIYEHCGNRVVESRTTNGKLVAVKIKPREWFRRSEAAMMQYASDNGILAPRVLGCYNVKPNMTVTVTDRVPGESLDKVWHTLTKPQKRIDSISASSTEFRKHTQPYIGRVGNKTTYNFFDRLHNNDMGPFASEEEFDEWCFARVKFPLQQAFWKRYLPKMRNKKPSKFVLTHGDLAARNIMVRDGRITGIVDWEYSGFFPEYMEYALATVIHDNIEEWWLPVLKKILEPSGYLRSKFIATIKDRGW
ncbi:kinase-like protein [Aspergillus sclerotioniger CBS 115572]|uniref:non-specific serine/threonine protein kinase n=1 Tax=Aspergillus sclerotioniger CBS 115572 TaxID=1450535 RepID=A0A317WD21_9EURO|nr:kinase-like protein [Aspergillus sclerotioniger CBS 115572]PWY83102.1 kinase-like protein [Aspergillus sclerotioniger CBS 115572]